MKSLFLLFVLSFTFASNAFSSDQTFITKKELLKKHTSLQKVYKEAKAEYRSMALDRSDIANARFPWGACAFEGCDGDQAICSGPFYCRGQCEAVYGALCIDRVVLDSGFPNQ